MKINNCSALANLFREACHPMHCARSLHEEGEILHIVQKDEWSSYENHIHPEIWRNS